MKKLEKYSNQKTYMYPNGELATPERMAADFPAIEHFSHIIETDESGEVCFAVQNLSAIKSIYNIPLSTNDDEAIALIQEIINAPTPEPEVSAEERIAAALEFNNILNM